MLEMEFAITEEQKKRVAEENALLELSWLPLQIAEISRETAA